MFASKLHVYILLQKMGKKNIFVPLRREMNNFSSPETPSPLTPSGYLMVAPLYKMAFVE